MPASTGYDIARGALLALRYTGGDFSQATERCLADNRQALDWEDSDPVPAHDGFWYLVRAVNCGGPGTWDSGSPSQQGGRDSEMQASPSACP